jgi:phosphoglycolate phosphatase
MKRIDVVAFDCDGVMFDTELANQAYYNHLLQHFGRAPMSPTQLAFVHMHTVNDAVAHIFGDEQTVEAAHAYRKTLDYRLFIKYLQMEPNLVPLLVKLKPRFKTAIATNRTDTINRLLSEFDLNGYFDLVVTALDIQRPKPHPDPLLKILDHFQREPGQVLYVGDSQLDEMAAQAANVRFVAYRNPGLTAEYHISSLKDLETLLGL